MNWTHAGHIVSDHQEPLLVGVINISPESFFKGSIASARKELATKIAIMSEYNVACLDVGAMSTRPLNIYGGERASIEEEKSRIEEHLPVIIEIAESYEIPVAVDTQYAEIAKIALGLGADVINDISGFITDPDLPRIVGDHDADVVIMATNSKPGDVCGIEATMKALEKSIQIGVNAGIERKRIAVDPGFGGWQGRDKMCDIELLQHIDRLKEFNLPIYVGVSRKSTIKTLDGGDIPEDRLVGSIVLTNWLVDNGIHIIRTHDVKETRLGLNVHSRLADI